MPCERVDPAPLFPSFAGDDLAFALLEPEAGVLRARDATRALAADAAARGARLVAARARPDGAAVVLDDGTRLEADRVAWACGAWLPRLFGDLVRLRVTQQDVFFLGAGAAWATPGVPGWVDYDGAAYGLGDLDGRGVKVAPDVEGPEVDAETLRRVPRPSTRRACAPTSPRGSPRWPTRRSSAPARASTSSRPTRGSCWRRTPSTTAASGCSAAARGTASSTAPRWPSSSSAGWPAPSRPTRASRWATAAPPGRCARRAPRRRPTVRPPS